MKKIFLFIALLISQVNAQYIVIDSVNNVIDLSEEQQVQIDELINQGGSGLIQELQQQVDDNTADIQSLQSEVVRLDTRIDSLLANLGNVSPPDPVAPVLDSIVAQDTATLRVYYTEDGLLDSIILFYREYPAGSVYIQGANTDSGNTYLDLAGLGTYTSYQIYLKSKKGSLYSGQSNTAVGTTDTAEASTPPGGGVEGSNNHFVALSSSGLGDGSYGTPSNPYANAIAASSVGTTFWNSVGTNDTVYVDGGADSVVYTGISWVTPNGKDNYTITKGISDGHSGKVIFDGNNHSVSGAIEIPGSNGVTGVTISRMTFRDYGGTTLDLDGGNGYIRNILVDSVEVISHNRYGIFVQGENNSTDYLDSYHITIQNSKVLSNPNYYSQCDGIYGQYLRSFAVMDNTLRHYTNESSTTNRHSDPAQTYFVDTVLYVNNLVGWDNPTKTVGTQMLFCENAYANDGQNGFWLWYNNVMYHNTPSSENVCMKGNITNGLTNVTMRIAHNTLYSKREGSGRWGLGTGAGGDADTVFADNNLAVVLDAYHKQNINVEADYGSANYNILYDLDGGISNLSGISGTGNAEATVTLTDVTSGWTNYFTPNFDLSISSGAGAQNLSNDLQSTIEGIYWWGTPLSYDTIDGQTRDSTPDAGAY